MWTSVDHVHSERTMVRWGFPHDLRTPPGPHGISNHQGLGERIVDATQF